MATEYDLGSNSLPLSALFKNGCLHSGAAVQCLISDIDAQLDNNTKEIDLCLQRILSATNRLPGSRTFSSPKDALGYMSSNHTLEKDTCYDPEPDEASAIIKALSDSLEKNAGSEESILQEILLLASEEGLNLPLQCSPMAVISQSSSSLNVQIDTVDQIVESKWSALSQTIKKHLISELLKLAPLGPNRRYSWLLLERRLELVGGLKAIASEDEAWEAYSSVRSQQLELLFNSLLPDNDLENIDYKEFCGNCDAVADRLIEIIEEDFSVLASGVFKKIGGVSRILHDIYLEKYSDEMSVLVEEIADDIRDFNRKVVKTSRSDHGISKSSSSNGKSSGKQSTLDSSSSNNTSALGSRPNEWTGKDSTISHSLETMFLASSYKVDKDKLTPRLQKQSSMAFPKDCVTALRHVAMSLIKLEDYLENLMKFTLWDVTGFPSKKIKKKSSLRGVLKTSASPDSMRQNLNLGSSFSSSDNQVESSSTTTQIMNSNDVNDLSPPRVIIERNRSEDKVRWDWRLIFKKISSGLATAVETKMDHAMGKLLTQEKSAWKESGGLETVYVQQSQNYLDGVDRPRKISKEMNVFISEINELLPLARAGVEGCLIPVRTAFIDSLGICVKNYHLHSVQLSKEIPNKGALEHLLTLISNAVHIKNYLLYTETFLSPEESGKMFMTNLKKQYTELISGLGKHLVQLESQLISTANLCDADSSNWSDLKYFYEDERFSFSIQMWNFHLRNMRHNMWEILPPKIAQNLFGTVLQDSLLLLVQRYAHVKPSYRRVKQLRYDIIFILLSVSDHLLKCSTCVSDYIDPGCNQLPQYSIHNQCSNLLATMAVLTSPIDVIYRVYKKGFTEAQESMISRLSQPGKNSQWLHWIWPGLFKCNTKHYDDLQTTSALYLHLTLLFSQPTVDWGMLMQAFLMKDYTLSVLLLSKICLSESSKTNQLTSEIRLKCGNSRSHENVDEELMNSPLKFMSTQKSLGSSDSGSPGVSRSPSDGLVVITGDQSPPSDIEDAVDAFGYVLSRVHYFPDALAKCIVPIIERCCMWEMFDIKNPAISPHLLVPEWLRTVFTLLDPFVDRVLESLLRYLVHVKTRDTYIKPVISYVADLPCGCPPKYSLQDHLPQPTSKEVLYNCLELIISEIEKSILTLPASVCTLFAYLEVSCKEQGIKTSNKCVAFHIISWAIWLRFAQLSANKDNLDDLLSSTVRSQLLTLADSLFSLFVFGKDPSASRLVAKFFKAHEDWLQQKFTTIAAYIMNDCHSHTDVDVTEAATNDFNSHIYSMMATSVMDTPDGYRHMKTLSNLVRNNAMWLTEQMDVETPLSSQKDEHQNLLFRLDLSTPKPPSDFNPVQEMFKLGDWVFSQTAIINFPIDWVSLLSSDLGLSQAAFRQLLMNRPELQDGATLEETEKRPVDVLKAVYDRSVE